MGVSERRKPLMFEDCKGETDKKIRFLSKSFSHAECTTCVGLAGVPGGGVGSAPDRHSRTCLSGTLGINGVSLY